MLLQQQGADQAHDSFDTCNAAGVWMCRPDGTAVPGFTGAKTALPVLADLFGLLPPAPRDAAPDAVPAEPAAAAAVRLLFLAWMASPFLSAP